MPAEITITVTSFVSNASETPSKSAALNCAIDLAFQLNGTEQAGPNGTWKIDSEGEVFLCPAPDLGTIAVRRKNGSNAAVPLTFRIASAAGVPALRPTKIVFEQENFKDNAARPKTDPAGANNFRNQRVSADNTLTVDDHWLDKGKSKNRSQHAAPHWKFWIRVTAANGQTGWIDPSIENSDDMSA